MAVLRLTSKKTLPVLIEALTRLEFSQTSLAESTKTSIGRVNKVITWLKQKDLVIKETGKYVIAQPNRVADIIASQQVIKKKRTYHINLSKQEAQEILKGTYCLQSALENYDEIEEEQLHLIDEEHVQKILNTIPRGDLQVHLYTYEVITRDEKLCATEAVRTIIDLKSVNKGYLAEELAMKLWGTKQ